MSSLCRNISVALHLATAALVIEFHSGTTFAGTCSQAIGDLTRGFDTPADPVTLEIVRPYYDNFKTAARRGYEFLQKLKKDGKLDLFYKLFDKSWARILDATDEQIAADKAIQDFIAGDAALQRFIANFRAAYGPTKNLDAAREQYFAVVGFTYFTQHDYVMHLLDVLAKFPEVRRALPAEGKAYFESVLTDRTWTQAMLYGLVAHDSFNSANRKHHAALALLGAYITLANLRPDLLVKAAIIALLHPKSAKVNTAAEIAQRITETPDQLIVDAGITKTLAEARTLKKDWITRVNHAFEEGGKVFAQKLPKAVEFIRMVDALRTTGPGLTNSDGTRFHMCDNVISLGDFFVVGDLQRKISQGSLLSSATLVDGTLKFEVNERAFNPAWASVTTYDQLKAAGPGSKTLQEAVYYNMMQLVLADVPEELQRVLKIAVVSVP